MVGVIGGRDVGEANPFEFDGSKEPSSNGATSRTARRSSGPSLADRLDSFPQWAKSAFPVVRDVSSILLLIVCVWATWSAVHEYIVDKDYWEVQKAKLDLVAVAEVGAASGKQKRTIGDSMADLNEAQNALAFVRYQEMKFSAKHNRDPLGYSLLFEERNDVNYFALMEEGKKAASIAVAKSRDSKNVYQAAKEEMKGQPTYRRLAAKFGK